MEDGKTRFSTYLSENLDDGLTDISTKTGISKNSLISLAVSKLLSEFGVLPIDSEVVPKEEVLKTTGYCDLLKQGKIVTDPYICTIERIRVRETNEEEIRFAYYKLNKNGNERLILRPLDVNENELLMIFADAISKGVFSEDFRRKLSAIL